MRLYDNYALTLFKRMLNVLVFKKRFFVSFPSASLALGALLALSLACCIGSTQAFAQSASFAAITTANPVTTQSEAATLDEVRSLIEALPAVTDVVEEDGEAIAQARAAYESLAEDEQALLDTQTSRAALGTTQSYGRVLELAEAGYAVLHAVDDSTTLADGLYSSSVTCSWDRGKSASKQDRDWTVVRVRVEDGHALVVLRVNSATYSYVRAAGQVVKRLESSGDGESLFRFPVSLSSPMVFTAYSQTMAAEIAYNLYVSVPENTPPDASLDEENDEDGQTQPDVPSTAPEVTVDGETGNVVVESGIFDHPEVTGYMFRMVKPAVITSDGSSMTAYFQMPSSAYSHLYLGSAEEADAIPLEEGVAAGLFIPAQIALDENGNQVGCFTFPFDSLDRDLSLSLYSVKNQHWVDQKRDGSTIQFKSANLTWRDASTIDGQTARVIDLLENLPARNTIDPDDATHEAVVRTARDAYEALDARQKGQVPARLTLLLEWDESMFDLGFNTDFLPLALVGQDYDGAIYVSGKNGSSGKTASIADGSLPDGLELLMSDDGLWAYFDGAPERIGSWTFTVELGNDLGERASKEFTIHVGYAPRILTDALPAASVGIPYDAEVVADAYPDATWSLSGGALPNGLSLVDDGDASGAAHIVGTPLVAGAFRFTLACDNFANGVERKEYSITVAGNSPASDDEVIALKQQLEQSLQHNAELEARVKDLGQQIEALKSQLPKQVTIDVKTVTAKAVAKALTSANNPYATTITLGPKVARIKAGAFKGTKVRTLVAQTKKLTKKSVRKSLAGSKVKTVKVEVTPKLTKKITKRYKSAFAKKNCGKKVSVR